MRSSQERDGLLLCVTSGCRLYSRRVLRLRNRKRVRRKCHGGSRSRDRRHTQLPAGTAGLVT